MKCMGALSLGQRQSISEQVHNPLAKAFGPDVVRESKKFGF